MYFTTVDKVFQYVEDFTYIREVKVPDGYEIVSDAPNGKYRAHALYLEKRRSLSNLKTWKWLVKNGCTIDPTNTRPLEWACLYNYGTIVKYFIQKFYNKETDVTYAIRTLCKNPKSVELVKYLYEYSSTSYDKIETFWEDACSNGNTEIMKYFMDCGIDPSKTFIAVLEYASRTGDLDFLKKYFTTDEIKQEIINNTEKQKKSKFGNMWYNEDIETTYNLLAVIRFNHINVLQFLYEIQFPLNVNMMLQFSLHYRYFNAVKFIIEHYDPNNYEFNCIIYHFYSSYIRWKIRWKSIMNNNTDEKEKQEIKKSMRASNKIIRYIEKKFPHLMYFSEN